MTDEDEDEDEARTYKVCGIEGGGFWDGLQLEGLENSKVVELAMGHTDIFSFNRVVGGGRV